MVCSYVSKTTNNHFLHHVVAWLWNAIWLSDRDNEEVWKNVSYTYNQLLCIIFERVFAEIRQATISPHSFLQLFKCQWIYLCLFMNHIPPKHGQHLKSVYLYVQWCTCSLEKPDGFNTIHSSLNILNVEHQRWRISFH